MSIFPPIITPDGKKFTRTAWTGGDIAPKGFRRQDATYKFLVSYFFKEQLKECGGLDLWVSAGTSSMERARIFWNRAKADAWATYRERFVIKPMYGAFVHEGDGRFSGHVIHVYPRRKDGKYPVQHHFGNGKMINKIYSQEQLLEQLDKLS